MEGWLKLWRQTIENPVIFRDAEYFAIWIYLLIQAKYEETPTIFNGESIILQKGQFTIGRKQISKDLHVSESKIQRVLKCYETEQQIEQQTCNKNRLITILNWKKYQGAEQQNELQMNNKRTTSEQPVNTPKEVKKERSKEIKEDFVLIFPEWLDQKLFNDFIQYRKDTKSPMTDQAKKIFLNKLIKAKADGYDVNPLIEEAIEKNWKSIVLRELKPIKEIDKVPCGQVRLPNGAIMPKERCHLTDKGWVINEKSY